MPYVNLEKRRLYNQKWNKEFYRKNKKQEIARVAKRKADIRDWLTEYRRKISCQNCGENHPACLDFHHTDKEEKDFTIGNARAMGWSKKRLLLEIQKCVVICANCHRKLHAKEAKVK